MIYYCHDTVVCLFVRLSVTMCIVALRVSVAVKSCTVVFLAEHFLFHFFGHLCCKMYPLATEHSERTSLLGEKADRKQLHSDRIKMLAGIKYRLLSETVNKYKYSC